MISPEALQAIVTAAQDKTPRLAANALTALFTAALAAVFLYSLYLSLKGAC